MAQRKPSGLIVDKVKISHMGRAALFTLPINLGFADPNEVDKQRGVPRGAVEVLRGERAIAAVVIGYYTPVNVRAWLARKQQEPGGLPKLAHDLVDIAPVPITYQQRSNKHNRSREEQYEKNILRALQRSAAEKKPGRKEEHPTGIRDIDYLRRIALQELRQRDVLLAVRGWWKFSEQTEDKTIRTDRKDPQDLAQAQRVIRDGGAGLVSHIEMLVDDGLELVTVNSLQVQVMPSGYRPD